MSRYTISYYHEGQWKSGDYDPETKIFVVKAIGGNVNTVLENVGKQHIKNLRAAR
jgi:hypothetical protein